MKKYFSFFPFLLLFLLPHLVYADGGRSIAVLFDVSKSVPAADFQQAREGISQLEKQAGPNDKITLYIFGENVKKVGPVDLQQTEPTESRTMLYDAVYDAAQALAAADAERKAIVIVSDGNDTSSATVLDDSVAFARSHGIVIYGIGAGKVNRRSLERIAMLTGGKIFSAHDPNFAQQISASIDAQKTSVSEKPAPPVQVAPATPAPAPARNPASNPPAASTVPVAEKSGLPYLWIAGIFGGVILLLVIGLIISRSSRMVKETRTCPDCGRVLDPLETVCSQCSNAITNPLLPKQQASAPTQKIAVPSESEIEELIPRELLEKKPVSEEDISKTFVLFETPVLVVRKGKNLGQSFSLHRAFPISIGRSKVNEILLEDVAVSGQHCRIIPENGKHVLYDLGSTNGTFVNEQKVHKAILKEGDTIKIGETQFVFRLEQHRN